MLLLNSAGLQAGVGEVAEIYVRSPHLARGYLGLEEETQKKFILNPFTAHLHGIIALFLARDISWSYMFN